MFVVALSTHFRCRKIPPTLPVEAPAEREERTTTRWEVTCLPLLHSEQSGLILSHDRTVSRKVVRPWEQSIVRNDIEYPSPPRGVAMHDISELNPAGCVDKKENENMFGPLADETDNSPAAKSARLKPVLDAMARGVDTALSEPCEKAVCIGREESAPPSKVNDSDMPSSQMTAVPPARGGKKAAGSSELPNGASGEGDKSGASGENEKEAPKSDNVDVMEEEDDEIELPPVEFDPEVQAKLVRWSPEFAECSITLYLPMPTYMTQGAMMDAAKAALNREKQLLDMRVSAGSRVVIKVRQAELKSWIGERNWFVLENEEAKSFRGIWCLPPRADRPEKVKDSTFTIQIKGIGMNKYASGYVQQQLFSAAAVRMQFTLLRVELRVELMRSV